MVQYHVSTGNVCYLVETTEAVVINNMNTENETMKS